MNYVVKLPFGEDIAANVGRRSSVQGYGGDNVRQKFATYERDNEASLDFAQNRYYNYSHGRFTSVDPYNVIMDRQYAPDDKEAKRVLNKYIGNPQNWNQYNYALNNPLKYNDPDGLPPKITIDLNAVYDRDEFTEEQAKKAMDEQIKDLQKTYGALDIEFNVTFTAGTANKDFTEITSGAKDDAVNVFFGKDNNSHKSFAHTNLGNGKFRQWTDFSC